MTDKQTQAGLAGLLARLRAVESDPIGCGLARNWHRNPDGPEAADWIEAHSRPAEGSEGLVELANELRPYAAKSVGSIRIDVREVAKIVAALDAIAHPRPPVVPDKQPAICEHGIRSPWPCDSCDAAAWAARPPVAEPGEDIHPFAALKALIGSDPEYAWAWHCNIAVPIMDICFDLRLTTTANHERANQAAALILSQLFDVDITRHPHWTGKKSGAQSYFEARVQAEREEDALAAAPSGETGR